MTDYRKGRGNELVIILNFILVGYVCNTILSYFMHYWVFRVIVKDVPNEEKIYHFDYNLKCFKCWQNKFKWWIKKIKCFCGDKEILRKNWLKYILSVDYYFADCFKNLDPINKNDDNSEQSSNKTKYIKKSNKANAVISLVLFSVIASWLLPFQYLNSSSQMFLEQLFSLKMNLTELVNPTNFVVIAGIFFIIIRTISRSLEIMVAFYKDISNHDVKKSSTLKSGDRIILAIISYFEIILNYAVVYYILERLNIFADTVEHSELLKGGIENLNTIFYSVGISTFTGVNFGNTVIVNCIILLQLLTSMCLVYFALAKYISGESNGITATAIATVTVTAMATVTVTETETETEEK